MTLIRTFAREVRIPHAPFEVAGAGTRAGFGRAPTLAPL